MDACMSLVLSQFVSDFIVASIATSNNSLLFAKYAEDSVMPWEC